MTAKQACALYDAQQDAIGLNKVRVVTQPEHPIAIVVPDENGETYSVVNSDPPVAVKGYTPPADDPVMALLVGIFKVVSSRP